MRPQFITHVKEGISFTFKLKDVTYMKYQHGTISQRELYVVYVNTALKIFFNEKNWYKLHDLWTSPKPTTVGRVRTLDDEVTQ